MKCHCVTCAADYQQLQSFIFSVAHHPIPIQSNSSMQSYECVALCKHHSPERPILCQISSLMYPKIHHRQVIMRVLYPGCAQLPWWSQPILWRRFKAVLASICVLIHSCKMPKESETKCNNNIIKYTYIQS